MKDGAPDSLTVSSRDAHRQTWAIAFPAILANSSAPLVGLVDTWAVGHLPGAVHPAAAGLRHEPGRAHAQESEGPEQEIEDHAAQADGRQVHRAR